MAKLLANAFSLNMLANLPATVRVEALSKAEASELARNAQSVVGHADTAAVFGDELGYEVPANRTTVSLEPGDVLVVGQYRGPRLPEGATKLPEGATISWMRVTIE
ncbi:DUF1874 domain-containing protein [Candidatus Parcubacteria bacterium]|nr:MAG: DUF1874 domain-containing protein [Candidatus Parcubacteria bacterium]